MAIGVLAVAAVGCAQVFLTWKPRSQDARGASVYAIFRRLHRGVGVEVRKMDQSDVSRQVNNRIAAMSAGLDGDGALEVQFLCECGCFSWVTMVPATYAAHGAWLDGHGDGAPARATDSAALG